jgi:DNA-binding transcriptional LysR family regulator
MPIELSLFSAVMTADLRHLRAFLAIADEGTITGAAARLNLTQPALSRTLRQLETHLGLRLVDRSTHHLHLTPAGLTFRERASAAVAAVDEVLDPARAGTWPLRLGHAWGALGEHTTALLRRWRDDHPEVALEVMRFDDDTSAGLASGRVDVALLRTRLDGPGIRAEALAPEPRLAAVPSGTRLADREHLTLADLATRPIAINAVVGTTTMDLWPAGHTPTETVVVANTDDWITAIAGGRAVGVTTVATRWMRPHPGVTYLPLTDAPPVDVYLAWREPRTHPAVGDLLALVRELAGSGSVKRG